MPPASHLPDEPDAGAIQPFLELACRCGVCGKPLVLRSIAGWPLGGEAGLAMDGNCPWESFPARPPGATTTPAARALACPNADCRRVYLVWDQIPNLMLQEAGVLTPVAFAAG